MFSAATKSARASTSAANYIEDVFSTYLYAGNNTNRSINNGIDLAGKGGMLWIKDRTDNGSWNVLVDTVRGSSNQIYSNATNAQYTDNIAVTGFNSNGFSLGTDGNNGYVNYNFSNPTNYTSWTFAKQPKFFDVVQYTGDGNTDRSIAHNLGSTPGMIIVKCTSSAGAWPVYHRSADSTFPYQKNLFLNNTAAQANNQVFYQSSGQTSTYFTLGQSNLSLVNGAGLTYVAYLFAHNAGGFGTAGTDNAISCGSFTTDGSGNATVNLGYEPQYILCKYSNSASNWYVFDTMRGLSLTGQNGLFPNQTYAESRYSGTGLFPTATGFSTLGTSLFDPNVTLIYMAIRRPMKVPTDATKVFAPVTYTGNSSTQVLTTGFTVDAEFVDNRTPGGQGWQPGFNDRLRGNGFYLTSSSTAAEGDFSAGLPTEFQSNTAVNRTSAFYNYDGGGGGAYTYVTWTLARRPGFFDEVCYTGTSTQTNVPHNLGVAPELIIARGRSSGTAGESWVVYAASQNQGVQYAAYLQSTGAYSNKGQNIWGTSGNAVMTSTTFSVGNNTNINESPQTYVAYLFATCPGVSKVGSYTGTGATQTINCGFTGGARFVLIKRTDSTGDWYTYDTARGMTTVTDPYLLLNSTAAETNTLGSVTTTTGGFTVNAAVLPAINTSGASYIFLAIA